MTIAVNDRRRRCRGQPRSLHGAGVARPYRMWHPQHREAIRGWHRAPASLRSSERGDAKLRDAVSLFRSVPRFGARTPSGVAASIDRERAGRIAQRAQIAISSSKAINAARSGVVNRQVASRALGLSGRPAG